MFQQVLLITYLFILIVSCCCANEHHPHPGHCLIRSQPQNLEQLRALQELHNLSTDAIRFLFEPKFESQEVNIVISFDYYRDVTDTLDLFGVPFEKVSCDSGSSMIEQRRPVPEYLYEAPYFNRAFHSYAMMESKLKRLARDPRFSYEPVGRSFEGRNLYLVKISTDVLANKPVILIDAGQHAREWATHASVFYIMESFINPKMPRIESEQPDVWLNQSLDTRLGSVLNHFDLWFVPVVNPDGYEYSRLADRFWRKNRQPTFDPECVGSDVNRNFPIHWKAREDTCSEVYPGAEPFSEPEAEILGQIMVNNSERILMYLSLHSYGQYILSPYGFTDEPANNQEDLMRIMAAGSKSMSSLRGLIYMYGPSRALVYPNYGTALDFAHAKCGIKFPVAFELTNLGAGFVLSTSQIVPLAMEALLGLIGMAEAILEL